jgi:hypothetical protein
MKINGTPVVDAPHNVKLTITAADIRKGDTKDPGACAAAQACMRQLHAKAARVHIGRTYLLIDKKWMRFQTPGDLRSEIVAFDRGGTFEPGEYHLAAMSPANKLGKRQGSNKPKKNRIKRAKPHIITGIRAHGAAR